MQDTCCMVESLKNQAESAILNSSQGRNCNPLEMMKGSISIIGMIRQCNMYYVVCTHILIYIFTYACIHIYKPIYTYILWIWIQHVHCSIVYLWCSNGCAFMILFKLFIWDLIWSSWTYLILVKRIERQPRRACGRAQHRFRSWQKYIDIERI